METHILKTSFEKDYELLDSGDGQKLERFGKFVLSRPDPQALWKKNLRGEEWEKADGIFDRVGDKYDDYDGKGKANDKALDISSVFARTSSPQASTPLLASRNKKSETSSKNQAGSKGRWKLKAGTPEKWQINFADLKFFIEPTSFKHVGLFPEQKGNWEWMREQVKTQKAKGKSKIQNSKVESVTADTSFVGLLDEPSGRVLGIGNRGIARRKNVSAGALEVLNLFGYTGGATLACAQAGAGVVHVDGSKISIKHAKENAELSGLADKPIRWILEDAHDFVKRELRRGRKYDGIIMDPPSFGRGDKGQVWKIEEDFLSLFNDCLKLLSDKPLFFLINGYAAGYSSIAYANNLEILKKKFGGTVEAGELTIEESRGSNGGNEPQVRFLPCGIFARWAAE